MKTTIMYERPSAQICFRWRRVVRPHNYAHFFLHTYVSQMNKSQRRKTRKHNHVRESVWRYVSRMNANRDRTASLSLFHLSRFECAWIPNRETNAYRREPVDKEVTIIRRSSNRRLLHRNGSSHYHYSVNYDQSLSIHFSMFRFREDNNFSISLTDPANMFYESTTTSE